MINYKKYIIYQGDREIGIPWQDIEDYILPPKIYQEFEHWMQGQTCGIVGGISVCYTCDLERFLSNKKLI